MTDNPLPAPLAEVLAEIERQRSALISDLGTWSAEQTTRAPSEADWNAAEVVDHLLLAEGFTNDITVMLVGKAKAAGEANGFPPDLASLTPVPEPISLEAPGPIQPKEQRDAGAMIDALKAMGARTTKSISELSTVDPRTLKMPHPLFGVLDLGQWWTVIAVHYEMHIAQAREATG